MPMEIEGNDGQKITVYTADELEAEKNKLTESLNKKIEEFKLLAGKAKDAEKKLKQLEKKSLEEQEQYQELWKTAEADKEDLLGQLESMKKAVAQKEMNNSALKIASTLAQDAARSQLIQEQVIKFAKYDGDSVSFELDGVKATDKQVTEHIKKNFPFLVDGEKNSGGGAQTGNAKTKKGTPPAITRQELETIPHAEKLSFFRAGGKVTD